MAEISLAYRDQSSSSPRHLRNDGEDDDNSVSSTASSVHEIIVFETDRRKERIYRIRLRRKIAQLGLHGNTDNPDDPVLSSGSAGGIMSVRTLDESLHGTKISEMRKLRRKMTIKVKNLDVFNGSNSTANGTGSTEESDDVSVISGLSGLSLSTAGNSSLNVKLGFSHVHIREYELVPGANPSVSSGPPVELGWAHTEPTSVEFDKWESIRDGRRRLQAQMRIPPHVRRELLLHHGNAQKDIRDATRNAATGRKQRIQTLDRLHRGNVDEMVDTVKRAFNIKRVFKKKKAEKELYGS
jgi:hypothetical protein